eukprot:1142074-Pelagomonas_calceolata.AAC.2
MALNKSTSLHYSEASQHMVVITEPGIQYRWQKIQQGVCLCVDEFSSKKALLLFDRCALLTHMT